MAKLPNITLTRGTWGTPSYVELVVPCRVLKDGVFRGTFPDTHADNMRQFYETDAGELTAETLAGLTQQLNGFATWLAESTSTTMIVLFYQTEFNGQFSLSGNKLIEPDFTTAPEWKKHSMSFLTNAVVAVGARVKRLTTTTGRNGQKTYTLEHVQADDLGEFGARLLAYSVGPEIRGRHTNPENMPRFVEYTEPLAEMFVQEIEATYYRAVELQDRLDALDPINDNL